MREERESSGQELDRKLDMENTALAAQKRAR
jgi:hypothetical protein